MVIKLSRIAGIFTRYDSLRFLTKNLEIHIKDSAIIATFSRGPLVATGTRHFRINSLYGGNACDLLPIRKTLFSD